MPKGDQTGPMGAGSKSGRKAGFCSGFNMPGWANSKNQSSSQMGMAHRRGQRRGGPTAVCRGWRNRFYTGGAGRMYYGGYATPAQPSDPELKKAYLENRSQALQSELEAINKQLKTINLDID